MLHGLIYYSFNIITHNINLYVLPFVYRKLSKDIYLDLSSQLKGNIPDIAGVRIPSPITMEEPTRTSKRSAFFLKEHSSNHLFVFAANDRS